eukprot:scaffold6552_cov26-Tisochrysis_lutea.AAC.1
MRAMRAREQDAWVGRLTYSLGLYACLKRFLVSDTLNQAASGTSSQQPRWPRFLWHEVHGPSLRL